MDFQNSSYIIMGGTSGMGLAAAVALQNQGAKVLVVGRDDESFGEAKRKLGASALALGGDATHPETIDQAIQMAHQEFGTITGLFHVAGGSGRKYGDGPLHELTLDGWNKTFEINLTAMMLSNRAMVNYFLEHKQPGMILNMGSVLGFSPSPKYFVTHAYAAAKSAVVGFSKSIASYYASHSICVNVIAPSLFETPMARRAMENEQIQHFLKSKQPLDGGRPGRSEDILNAVLMFLAPDSNFITGQVLAIDGGWSISEGQYQ
ncbi:SDR family NAD(P)-dependent oxidoreductase [Algoriphagus antarcticus]|uniref:NAD(P)-dependent dehydrogenase (Short-subunit alcohol dehydrogenase family) n=1 Tax=Algoriphagus antarcticus TaxID=238540 RepID=A0A3E0DXW1_9BACT|nr:SDR family oxidoreductase [Algoriphagus antarcticus]REG90293.1 NAD(P)-dependent dehydrogenase (short-subunit alcohol dehydrogenase family) [Algoriphagus antarcticus]